MLSAKSLLYSSSDQCDLKVGESSKCAVLKCVDQSGNFRTFSLLCNNASIHTAGITVYFILFFFLTFLALLVILLQVFGHPVVQTGFLALEDCKGEKTHLTDK